MPVRQNEEEKVRGKGQEEMWVARTDEERKWDEGPSGVVEGNGDPHYRRSSQNQTDRPLKIRQADSEKESKSIGLLG